MVLENVCLPYYTEKEDRANSISHIVGVIFGAIAMIILLLKSHDISHVISSIIFGAAMIILYSGSSIYHRLPRGKAKRIARLVDHSVIFVLITGTSIPLIILDVLPYYRTLAIVCISVSVVTAILGIALTFIDQEKYKKLQMVLYMVLGWMCIFLFYPIYKCDPNALLLFGLLVLGGAVYTLGTIFYSIGRFKRYYHFIFHLFILGGTVTHFLAFLICLY
ncbi:MAG TPA: hemolysin III family protein [Ruminococcaceae bacterium]|nr:hemolysin III family protein [Oscillospiraceae bacterium]